nr:hypothetical protein [uncultured Leptotrichia sp.]
MREKILNFLKNCIKKENIYIMFLSYLLAFCMFSYINQFIYKMLPDVELTISSYEPEKNKGTEKNFPYIALLEDKNTLKFYKLRNIFDQNKKLKENTEGFNYINVGDYGYNLNSIHMNNPKNKINIKLKKIPNSKILFYNIGKNKKLLLESERSSIILNVTKEKKKNFFIRKSVILDISKEEEGSIYSYYPFSESKTFLLYTLFIYLFLGILIFILLNIIKRFFKKLKIPKYFLEYNPKYLTLIIYVIISVYVSYKFTSNTLPKSLFLENRELFGDQDYYWKIGTIIKNHDWIGLQNKTATFRGYFSSVIPMISQIIGEILNINSLWICFMLNNIFAALLLGYIIPELNNKLNPRKAKNYQILILFTIFFMFWRGMFYTVLVDIMAVTFLLWSVLLFIKSIDKKKKLYIFFSGIFISIATLNRGNYIFGIYFVLGLFILNNILKIFKKQKYEIKNSFFSLFFLGIFIISIPQIKINYDKGHIGIFPYDTEKSWGNYSLTQSLLSTSLNTTLTGWPYLVKDEMTQKISENFGTKEIVPSINQTLTVYTNTPIVTIITILKKIFLSLDIKAYEVYPLQKFNMHTNFYLFSFFNYFILLSSFYFLINKKIRNKFFTKKELSVYGLLSSFLILSLIFIVEWRYFILNYLILYSIFCFKYFDFLKEKEFNKDSYLKFILFTICICFLINSSYYY